MLERQSDLNQTQHQNQQQDETLSESESFAGSAIYYGDVMHKRFTPKVHAFKYSLYMLALDVAEVEQTTTGYGLFGFSWYKPLRFVEKDYIRGEPFSLSTRIKNKVKALAGHDEIEKIVMLVQVRCFGIYFSPANFYFCYDKQGHCTQMLAEVSNTPWNERHYYLVDLTATADQQVNKKVFQVSPFLNLDMSYFWKVKAPSESNNHLMVNIQNKRFKAENAEVEKVFEASLLLKKRPFSRKGLFAIWCQLPVMTGKVVTAIYWQAIRLVLKRIPFLGYQKV